LGVLRSKAKNRNVRCRLLTEIVARIIKNELNALLRAKMEELGISVEEVGLCVAFIVGLAMHLLRQPYIAVVHEYLQVVLNRFAAGPNEWDPSSIRGDARFLENGRVLQAYEPAFLRNEILS
jgi:hypothetical protein